MPLYELALIVRPMLKEELVTALKRTGMLVIENGGLIRKVSSMGERPLPRLMKIQDQKFKSGTYFFFEYDAPPASYDTILDTCRRDFDFIRSFVNPLKPPPQFECTLAEELLPPPYREDVQKMVEIASTKTQKISLFKPKSGMDYYPFHK